MIRDEKACLRWRKYSRGLEACFTSPTVLTDVTCAAIGFRGTKECVLFPCAIFLAQLCVYSIAPPCGCCMELCRYV